MKLLIDIPEYIYEHARESSEDSRDEFDAMRAIANGSQQESRSEIPNKWIDAEVLDKIRAEIEAIEDGISSYHNDRPWIFKDEALAIIDKYKAESEDKDGND